MDLDRETRTHRGTGRESNQKNVRAEERLGDKKGDRVSERQEEIKGRAERERGRERSWRLQTTNRDLMRIWKVFSASSLPKPPGQPSLHSFHPRLSFQLLKRSERKRERAKPCRAPAFLPFCERDSAQIYRKCPLKLTITGGGLSPCINVLPTLTPVPTHVQTHTHAQVHINIL